MDQSPDCLSDYRLDKLMAGELDDAAATLAREHLASCASCTARADALESDRARFRADLPARTAIPSAPAQAAATPARVPRRGRLHRFTAPVAGLAAAAALALFLWPRRTTDDDSIDDPSRRKGGPSLGFYLARDGRVTAGASGDELAPGDRVRFSLTSDRPGYLVIGSVDAAGRASIYYPVGPRAAPFEAGADRLLPEATELDDALGREQVVGFFCERPVEVARALAALSGPDAALPGCRVDRLEWIKRAR